MAGENHRRDEALESIDRHLDEIVALGKQFIKDKEPRMQVTNLLDLGQMRLTDTHIPVTCTGSVVGHAVLDDKGVMVIMISSSQLVDSVKNLANIDLIESISVGLAYRSAREAPRGTD